MNKNDTIKTATPPTINPKPSEPTEKATIKNMAHKMIKRTCSKVDFPLLLLFSNASLN